MKLAFVFVVCFVGVAVTQFNRPFKANRIFREQPKYIVVAVDDAAAAKDSAEYNNYDPEDDDYDVISPTARQKQPTIQQFHHNENVNQFYYPLPSPSSHFLPGYTSARDDDDYFSPSSIASRRKNPFRPMTLKMARPTLDGYARFLFLNPFQNMFFPTNLYSYLNSKSSSVYSTTTSIVVLNSTLTTTLITPCVPATAFSTSNNIPQTNACRRRRDVMQLLSAAEEVNGPDYYPDQHMTDSMVFDKWGRKVDPEILSSKDEAPAGSQLPAYFRQGRSARYTVYSTFTSFTFVTVNQTKTASLGANLLCLPSGHKIC